MTTIQEYKEKFKRCILEYTSPAGSFSVEEDGDDDMMQGGDPGSMGGDPNAAGGDPSAMGGDPSAMGGDPNAMGGDPNAMGGDPNAMGGETGAEAPQGFQPQGVDPNAGLEGMGGDPNAAAPADPNAMGADVPMDDPNALSAAEGQEPGDDVIDVDDLTDSQEETEKKIDALSGKFEKLISSLDGLEKRISDIDSHTNDYLGKLENELEKRNPTPMQRLSMRSTKSAPYAMTPNEYMNNYAPENYSAEDDNNGADDPQYKITKGDIDDFTDYGSIAREFDGKLGLHDILGY